MREIEIYLSHFCFLIGRNPYLTDFFLFCVSKRFYFASCRLLQHARKERFLQRFTIAHFKNLLFTKNRRNVSKIIIRFFAFSQKTTEILHFSFFIPGVPRKRFAFLGWVPRSSFIVIIDKPCRLLYNHKDFYTQRTVLL